MQISNHAALLSLPTAEQETARPADRVSSLGFWLPTLVIGLAYLTQHKLQYASADLPNFDTVSDLIAEAGRSSVMRQVSFLAIGLLGTVLLLKPSRAPIHVNAALLFPFVMLCSLLLASGIWADDSAQSFKRSAVPLLTTAAALGVAKHWRFRQVLLFTVVVTSGYLLIGIAAEFASGALFLGGGHRFSGTLHPNSQAVNCAALSLASFALFAESRQRVPRNEALFWLMLSIGGLVFLFLTRSRTATVAVGASLIVFYMLGASTGKKLFFCGVLVQAATMLGILWWGTDAHEGFLNVVRMGREQDANEVASLTGRIPIWTSLLADVAERPLVGYGYGGFWTLQRVTQYSSKHGWTFMQAHSAYVETLLNLGLVGLTLSLAVIGGALLSAIRSYKVSDEQGFRFVAALLVMALVHGFLDGNFARDGFETIIAAVAIAMIVLGRGMFGKVADATG